MDEKFKQLLKEAAINPKPLLVCSGGTSSRCAADNHWTLDLRKNYKQIEYDPTSYQVEIDGGVTMGELIEELAKNKRSFPIGLSKQVGIGYILTGGIGPTSRKIGLAIDQILEINGVWGKGEEFSMNKPKSFESERKLQLWRALSGAAGFLGIITKLKLKTYATEPLIIWKAALNKNQLSEIIKMAEEWPNTASFQWYWKENIIGYCCFYSNDKFALEVLKKLNERFAKELNNIILEVNGINDLPTFFEYNKNTSVSKQNHNEVLGLLGSSWSESTTQLMNIIETIMKKRPNNNCFVAAQQLGGEASLKAREDSSFIHRAASWKPWINASWPRQDKNKREESIEWMYKAWSELEPFCKGVHLAQIHDHLPSHQKELKLAFGDWLIDLQKLKSDLDPHNVLPFI